MRSDYNESSANIENVQILEVVEESSSFDTKISSMNKTEHIINVNQTVEHHNQDHPSNLSEVVENKRIGTSLNNVVIKNADKMNIQLDKSKENLRELSQSQERFAP